MPRSIYTTICNSLNEENQLPEGFRLPQEKEYPVLSQLEPGAMDGSLRYQSKPKKMDYEHARLLARAMYQVENGDYKKADELFYEWTKDFPACFGKRHLHLYLNAHQTRLDIEEIYSTMVSILVNTTHIECVKVALNILETFKTHFDDAKEMIRRIGVYEEFTFSVMSVMRTWENSDDELLALAKKVHGWGRIIAVEFLQPTTDEIKHWLMTDGSSNTLDNSYTSVACWKKSGAEDLLFGNPTKEEYKAIGSLIMLMFQSKAASRREKTDSIGNLDEILERFIEISPNYDLDVEDYEKLVYTLNAVRASDPKSRLNDLLQNFLRSDDCVKKVRKAVVNGKGFLLAYFLDIPYLDRLLECVENDFDAYFKECFLLLLSPDYKERAMDIIRKHIPSVPNLATDEETHNKYSTQYNTLLLMLENIPFTGEEYIISGIFDISRKERRFALQVLKKWLQLTKKPLSLNSKELEKYVKTLKKLEMDSTNIELINDILNAYTDSPDQRKA